MSPNTTRVSGSGAKSPLLLQPIFLKKPKAVKAPVIEEIPEPVEKKPVRVALVLLAKDPDT